MDSIEIDNGLKTETDRYKPIKIIFEGDECSATEPESACEKLADGVKSATSEKPILVRWNKRTGTYEVMDNSFISDDALILDWCDSKTVIFLNHPEEEENCFTEEAFNGFMESMCECGLPNPISPSALRWLMEQDWFKNSDE